LGEILGRRAGEDNGKRGAALRTYDREIASAWKADQEFSNALYMAYVGGRLQLLRNYCDAGKPIPQDDVSVAGALVPMHIFVAQLLGDQPPQEYETRGRPHRVASAALAAEQAERNAAWLVAFAKKAWCKRNGRKRVPKDLTSQMIRAAIEQGAEAFKVPVDAIRERNVSNVLKNGSIVVA
jgi:cytochrome P450